MNENKLGDAPIEKEYRERMNNLARALDNILNGDSRPKKTGFCLMMFNFNDGAGRCNYISNCARSDVVMLLKEQLARFQGQPEMEGHG